MSARAAAEAGTGPDVAVVRDVAADGVGCRLYDPRGGAGAPVAVFLHGGGWCLGGLDTHDALCRHLAARSGCAVLAVDYRLAPEHPWPAAVEDAEAAIGWLRREGAGLGVDRGRTALVGDSAGGALAAVLARRARDAGLPHRAQVLVYPVIDPAMAAPSYAEYANGFGLTAEEMAGYWAAYLPDPANRAHPDAAPSSAGALAGLPPALVLTAEHDVLRDEGEAYALALAEAGVRSVLVRYLGVPHGFVRALALFDAAPVAADQAAAFLAGALSEAS